MLTKDELPECPVATTVQLIGNKWKLLIIRNLRALEKDGLVVRQAFAEVPPCVIYSLSELGNSLRPILKAMEDWGKKYKAK